MQPAFLVVLVVVYLAIIGVMVASQWKIYEKAGQPGWAALIPFYGFGPYSYLSIVEVCKMQSWWFWLLLVPCVNYVILLVLSFMLPFKYAEKFGKETGFAIGLLLLGIVF